MAGNWDQLSAADVASQLHTDRTTGLTESEAARRREKHGPNELIERGGRSHWQLLWQQLSGVLTVILVLAAVVSLFVFSFSFIVMNGGVLQAKRKPKTERSETR